MPKFDFIVQNPPYKRGLYIDFLTKGFNILSDTGKMIIITPSSWVTNLKRPNSSMYKTIDNFFNSNPTQLYSVITENYNSLFNTSMHTPFSILAFDKLKKTDKIDLYNCGEHRVCNSIYDCNFIGDYKIIQSILNKCKTFGDTASNHIYNIKKDSIENKFLLRIPSIFNNHGYYSDIDYVKTKFGEFYTCYVNTGCHKSDKTLYFETIPLTKSKTLSSCLWSYNKIDLENWIYYLHNNKLPIFINICTMINQENRALQCIPWIVDKKYTDDEIYKLLSINDLEQSIIDSALIKFERNSNWFKRYMGILC